MAIRAALVASLTAAFGGNEAYGQAFTVEEVTVTGHVLGAAIRNWGPTDEVFIASEEMDGTVNNVVLHYFTCSDGDGCATSTLVNTTAISDIDFGNHSHPSLGVRRWSVNDPVEVTIVSRIHGQMSGGLPTNCDNSNPAESEPDKINADLQATLWDTTNGTTDGDAVGIRTSTQCENFGVNTARFGRGEQWACYTHDPDGKHDTTLKDQLQCDNSENATIIWGNDVTMDNSMTQGEDHPSFEFYTSTDDLVVSGTARSGATGVAARVHFPDAVGSPIVGFGRNANGAIDHTDIAKGNGKLQMVFRDGKGSSAEIRYVECASATATDDCTLVGDWDEDASSVASGGTYPNADNPDRRRWRKSVRAVPVRVERRYRRREVPGGPRRAVWIRWLDHHSGSAHP